VARLRNARATSAGGVVVSAEQDRPSLVVGMRRRGRDGVTWTLPKGTPDPGETTEQTALREVAEETGLEVRIVAPLPSIEYAFIKDGTRIRKTVHYFLMEPTGGDLSRHDHEFQTVRWVPFAEAGGLLSFQTERDLVATAASRLGDAAPSTEAPRERAAASG
jgi:8-oxo-dGTP pyrophosphatase MutT (NUDIX family)